MGLHMRGILLLPAVFLGRAPDKLWYNDRKRSLYSYYMCVRFSPSANAHARIIPYPLRFYGIMGCGGALNEIMAKKAAVFDSLYRIRGRVSGIELQMKRVFALSAACAFIFFAGCSAKAPASHTTFVMDTFFTQTFAGDMELVVENDRIVSGIEREMSKTITGSDVFNLNKEGNYKPGPDTLDVLKTALEIAAQTGGAFDPALNPVIELWGIGERETDVIPPEREIDNLLPLTDYRDVTIDADGTVRLIPGAGIDLGGIAKGYALDRVAANIRENGVASALIDLGGSIAAIGEKTDGKKYRIGVRDPMGEANDYIATVELKDVFTSTSGVYERYFIKDGVRYHHIIDPGTGRPAESGLYACMIVSGRGILSDAYSTALFVMGAEKGLKFAKENGIDALFVTNDNKILMTDGFAQKYAFELTADDYEVI